MLWLMVYEEFINLIGRDTTIGPPAAPKWWLRENLQRYEPVVR